MFSWAVNGSTDPSENTEAYPSNLISKGDVVQATCTAHDGTAPGIIMIGLEGGCTGCSSTPMTAMQIYYALMKLVEVNDVVFVNGELPEYMRAFIDDKLKSEE